MALGDLAGQISSVAGKMLPGTHSYLIKSLVFDALLGLGLYFLADFSPRQTGALVLLVCLFQFLINDIWTARLEEKKKGRFIVFIQPNWYQILLEHRLIASEDDWHQLMRRALETPRHEYCVLRDGIEFTVLGRDLSYLNNKKNFVQQIRLDVEIPEIKIPLPNSPLRGTFSPSIVVEQMPSFTVGHPTWGGYQFSLVTPECMKSTWLESRQEPIKLAFLTTLEFGDYEIRPKRWIDSKAYQEQQNARRMALKKNGWKRAEKEDALGRKVSSRVEHKYFAVSHQSI